MQLARKAMPPDGFPQAIGRVSVVAADGHSVKRIRGALRRDGIDVLAHAGSVDELGEASGRACALVLAVATDALSEFTALVRQARARAPQVPLIVVATVSRIGVHQSLQAGAAGVVLESDIESALAPTVRAVVAGQVAAPRALRASAARPALSYRERETLALVARGLTNQQIADRLYVAESTVKTHLASIFRKLGVQSRNEAAAVALDPEFALAIGVDKNATDGGMAA